MRLDREAGYIDFRPRVLFTFIERWKISQYSFE